jgi:hypothetical protein
VTIRNSHGTNVQDISIPVVNDKGKYVPAVAPNSKKENDVAVINITEQVVTQNIEGAWIPTSLFATKEKIKNENIGVGDEIYLLGYPAGLYDERNTSPILRTGIIATVPTEQFAFNAVFRRPPYNLPDQIDGFLVDSNVYPGSSGSVVLLKPQSTTIGEQGQTVVSAAKKVLMY